MTDILAVHKRLVEDFHLLEDRQLVLLAMSVVQKFEVESPESASVRFGPGSTAVEGL